MKYIITESRVNDMVKLFLDKYYDFWVWDSGDGEFSVSNGYEGDTIMSYTIDYDTDEGILHISPKLIEQLSDMFVGAVNFKELMRVLSEWFNETYKTDAVHYEVMMED
jgi:hypothetical protein